MSKERKAKNILKWFNVDREDIVTADFSPVGGICYYIKGIDKPIYIDVKTFVDQACDWIAEYAEKNGVTSVGIQNVLRMKKEREQLNDNRFNLYKEMFFTLFKDELRKEIEKMTLEEKMDHIKEHYKINVHQATSL